jgi:hypothetical protein
MVRAARILLLLAALGVTATTTRAQAPELPAPKPTTPPDATAPGAPPLLLPGQSPLVISTGPPTPTFAPVNLPGPYFEVDPLLDRPPLPPPGCFADVDIGAVAPHVKNHLQERVLLPGAATVNIVALPSAGLDWTIFPRIETGYRLPSGFGAFSLSYRFLGTEGNGSTEVLDAPAALHSRLDLNEIGLDYSNNETSLWPNWDMKWSIGVRMLWVYFDSQAESFLGEQHESNWYAGFGPHVGLELDRQIAHGGLSLVLRGETSYYLGRLHQTFFEESIGTGGIPVSGETLDRVSQGVMALSVFAGVRWQPPEWHDIEFYLGYQYEHWWDIGKNNNTLSSGELDVQGIFVRAAWNF